MLYCCNGRCDVVMAVHFTAWILAFKRHFWQEPHCMLEMKKKCCCCLLQLCLTKQDLGKESLHHSCCISSSPHFCRCVCVDCFAVYTRVLSCSALLLTASYSYLYRLLCSCMEREKVKWAWYSSILTHMLVWLYAAAASIHELRVLAHFTWALDSSALLDNNRKWIQRRKKTSLQSMLSNAFRHPKMTSDFRLFFQSTVKHYCCCCFQPTKKSIGNSSWDFSHDHAAETKLMRLPLGVDVARFHH